MTIVLSRDQIRRIDELAINEYGIPGIVLMENAGRGAAGIIDRTFGPRGGALVVCGTGNNGGDGFVIARHLHNTGWSVRILIAGDPSRMSPDAAANDRIIQAMKLERIVTADGEHQRRVAESIDENEVVVDALLGTGFSGTVRSPLAELIAILNESNKRAMVAVDVPSGLDCDTGKPGGVAIQAHLTTTFVAAKKGFFVEPSEAYVGRVEVVDVGAPVELVGRVASEVARRP